jgi:hypothetical protein
MSIDSSRAGQEQRNRFRRCSSTREQPDARRFRARFDDADDPARRFTGQQVPDIAPSPKCALDARLTITSLVGVVRRRHKSPRSAVSRLSRSSRRDRVNGNDRCPQAAPSRRTRTVRLLKAQHAQDGRGFDAGSASLVDRPVDLAGCRGSFVSLVGRGKRQRMVVNPGRHARANGYAVGDRPPPAG